MELVEIASFKSRLEAETVANALDQYGIPHVVQSDDVGGMYGGIQFGTAGATLCVPESFETQTRRLLTCFKTNTTPEDQPE